MRRIGVTATRSGLTVVQVAWFEMMLRRASDTAAEKLEDVELHHGDCVGGDATIDALARYLGIRRVAHPGPGPFRAWCDAEEIREPKDFLPRDRDIVDECDELWAGPKESTQPTSTRGSGTWYTIGYGAGRVPVRICWPAGEVEPR